MARLASRERLSFSKLREVKDLPNLIEVQTDSFRWFLEEGVAEVLRDISPIEDFTGQLKLELTDHVFDPPKHSEDECRERDMTYPRPLFVTARFINAQTGEIKEQTVFMGDFPMMTDRGTFIINGTERIVVSQLVRSPGVYFGVNADKTAPEKEIVDAKVIPSRGAWLEFEVDKRDVVYVRIDRKRKQPVTVLLKALGFGETDEELLNLITDEKGVPYESMRNTLEKDHTATVDEAFIDIYRKLRPGEPPTPDSARALLENLFFNTKRYDQAKVGRHKVSKKLSKEYPLLGLKRFDLTIPDANVDGRSGDFTLTKADILATVSYLVKLHNRDAGYFPDDIDHFGNRRVRTVGELIQNQFRVGLSRMERVVRERMTTQDVEAITPQTLINIRPVVAAIKEFFGSSQLSQFMDQTNPLAGLTHKRRLSALGPGGLSRERAGFEVRDVHPSHYGRMCPIETPEGPNIGLIGYLSSFARINRFGFIETPYRKVEKGRVSDEIEYLAADDEDEYIIAQANARVDEQGNFLDERVLVRVRPRRDRLRRAGRGPLHGRLAEADRLGRDGADPVPRARRREPRAHGRQHAASGRAAAAGDRAVHRHRCRGPRRARRGRRAARRRRRPGHRRRRATPSPSTTRRTAGSRTGSRSSAAPTRAPASTRSRSSATGEQVRKGDVLADGPSTMDGELALGKNLLVAFMPWKGHNFEDAIVLSERLVKDDVLTSIHIEEHEIDARDTKLGAEEITRDIPNLSEDILKDLDERGIIRIGAEVGPGDILVGKVTPKGETELTPEERLLRAIFGEKAREVRDTSLKVPHGETGKVIDVRVFSRDDGHELPPGVNQLVRVYVGQKRKISEGDKLAGRHGNKGVISKILPVEDMPYLADGTPVDIVLNPLGVPSRMNVGQVLEAHLGYAARHGWDAEHDKPGGAATRPVRSPSPRCGSRRPVFDGAHWDEDDETGPRSRRSRRCSEPQPRRRRRHEARSASTARSRLNDGRTGEPFDRPVTVGYMYILKLSHLVDDKIHARSTGPYSMITQQPLGGKAQFGGQRFGEMEVWALEAYGAAYALQEILTIKSDDVLGRVKVYEAIVKGENIPEPGIPESFKVLIKEMQALCLNVRVIDENGQEIEIRELDEDAFRTTESLGIDLSRPERGTDEEDAARAARRARLLTIQRVGEFSTSTRAAGSRSISRPPVTSSPGRTAR